MQSKKTRSLQRLGSQMGLGKEPSSSEIDVPCPPAVGIGSNASGTKSSNHVVHMSMPEQTTKESAQSSSFYSTSRHEYGDDDTHSPCSALAICDDKAIVHAPIRGAEQDLPD